MAKSLLEQIQERTVVVLDTGDIRELSKLRPHDATTNAALIIAAAQMPEYAELLESSLAWARRESKNPLRKAVAKLAIDRLTVELGLRLLSIVPGRVATEVDVRLAHDVTGTVEKARALIKQYDEAAVHHKRVLIQIAATWEGIRAAELLEKEGIHCNLTLVFGMHQAIACAEAGVTMVSVSVGRILDWHMQHPGAEEYRPEDGPGVRAVTRIYDYYRRHGYRTEVMGTCFRNTGQVIGLAGCDFMLIPPKFVAELAATQGDLECKLDPARAAREGADRMAMSEATFREMHEADRMAREKLAASIDGLVKAQVVIERLIDDRITGHASRAARDLFSVFDLDGDGFITREEWTGLASVFDALDLNGDGRISPEEMALGLGAAFQLR